jgi:hypothetical protein
MKITTAQGRERTTHFHHISQVHLVDPESYRGRHGLPICGQHPKNLHTVHKEPTCKHCLKELKAHIAFKEFFKPASGPGGLACSIWDFPDYMRVTLAEDARLRLISELAYQGLFAKPPYHNLRKHVTPHPGRKTDRSNVPGGVTIRRLKQAMDAARISPDEMEQHICAVYGNSIERGLHGPFPVAPNEDWAFLAGLWYSGGTWLHRDRKTKSKADLARERSVRYRIDKTVAPRLMEIGGRIGCLPVDSKYLMPAKYFQKTYLKNHWARAHVIFPQPVYHVLRKFGLPPPIVGTNKGLRKGSTVVTSVGRQQARSAHLQVPDFVKHDPRLSRAFAEGYMNGPKFAAWRYRNPKNTNWWDTGAHIGCFAPTDAQCLEFAGWLGEVIKREGVPGNVWKTGTTAGSQNRRWHFVVSGVENTRKLLSTFRIDREHVQRLNTQLQSTIRAWKTTSHR